MNSNMDEFIKNICDGECKEYFQSSKKRAVEQIKTSLPPDISYQYFNLKLEIQIARVASPIIKKINIIDKNRFWIIYYRLAQRLILLKCNECKSSNKSLICEEYILDRIIQYIKKFDVDIESIPFKEVRAFIEKGEYNKKRRVGVTGNYIEKILKRYSEASIDSDTAYALIENAMIKIDERVVFQKDFSEEKINLKNEILKRLNHNTDKTSILLYSLLIELLHEEKFFNYINNHVIPKRFIDFIRRATSVDIEPEIPTVDNDSILKLDEVLETYLEIIPQDTKLILRLKIGERLNNRDFIKVAYLFDYREIDIFEYFTDDEHLQIKFYARNNIDISSKIDKNISNVREKLETNSYIDIKNDKKRVTLLKLIFSEEMKAKEIGMLLGYSEKQVYKKIENIKKKINNKKELVECKKI